MGVLSIHTQAGLSTNFESPIGALKKAYCPSLHPPSKPYQELNLSPDKSVTLSQFRYTDGLDPRNIRLLDIRPGQGEDVIHLDLRTYPLDCAPSYVALSYTWGDPKDTSTILCQGQTLCVTRNLKEALCQLRGSHRIFAGKVCVGSGCNKTPYFWIDAICINQNDNDEKSHQVKLMWEIYSRADLVIAWLGKQDEVTERGLELIKRITTVVEQRSNRLAARLGGERSYQSLSFTELAELGLPDITSPGWDHLFSVLTRQWFSRVWVIQELVAAKECIFLCGGDIIDSSMLLQLGQIIEEDKLLASIRNFNRNRILGVNIACLATLKLKEKQNGLIELLWSTHLFQATNPRDRVFAIVHMAHGMTPDMISDLIDYKLDTYEILNKTASICLRQGSLDLLSFAQAFGDLYSLPSWVPYWTASDYSYIPLIRSWDASTPVESHYHIEENHVSGADPAKINSTDNP
jgi:Heterokaryon incompatibility protein (HET)